jgi:hypothetical protein
VRGTVSGAEQFKYFAKNDTHEQEEYLGLMDFCVALVVPGTCDGLVVCRRFLGGGLNETLEYHDKLSSDEGSKWAGIR